MFWSTHAAFNVAIKEALLIYMNAMFKCFSAEHDIGTRWSVLLLSVLTSSVSSFDGVWLTDVCSITEWNHNLKSLVTHISGAHWFTTLPELGISSIHTSAPSSLFPSPQLLILLWKPIWGTHNKAGQRKPKEKLCLALAWKSRHQLKMTELSKKPLKKHFIRCTLRWASTSFEASQPWKFLWKLLT